MSRSVARNSPKSKHMMMKLLIFFVSVVSSQAKNAVFEASDYMNLNLRQVDNGILDSVDAVPDVANAYLVAHLFGTPKERGQAHGALLAGEIMEFVDTELPQYYISQLDALVEEAKHMPPKIEAILLDFIEKKGAAAFDFALQWVFEQQRTFMTDWMLEEMDGIADGVCSVLDCNATVWRDKIRYVNMLPELVRMECSMLGAWGEATPDSSLTQLRTLDFGAGPFANRTMLLVHHSSIDNTSFINIGFPGFVGVVTGVSSLIGLSEKVNDVTNDRNAPGSYNGLADTLVLRTMLQYATDWSSALDIAQNANRTWSIWVGIGGPPPPGYNEIDSSPFAAIAYSQVEALAYDDTTLPNRTSQAYIKNVAYLDKHPQPSSSPDLYDIIQKYYGQLNASNVAQIIPKYTSSGDVHAAVYAFSSSSYTPTSFYVAKGTTYANGTYIEKAYESPFIHFELYPLWTRNFDVFSSLS